MIFGLLSQVRLAVPVCLPTAPHRYQQKLHAEKAYCPHISRSLSCVVARSSNLQFKQDASELLRVCVLSLLRHLWHLHHLIQRLKKRLQSEATRITSAYERHLGIDEGQGTNLCQPIETSQTSEENILNIALSRLMRSHVRAPPFKVRFALPDGYRSNTLRATGRLHEFT